MPTTFNLIRSSRKTVAIVITREGDVVVRAPLRMPLDAIERFVHEKRGWIEEHRKITEERRKRAEAVMPFTDEEIREMTEEAKRLLLPRVDALAKSIGVTYGRVTVRHQRTRWGSCSGKGNLNFNCLLVRCPAFVTDYVILHELCHRKHMNHSPAFWKTLAAVYPQYDIARRWLFNEGTVLMARLRAGE